MSSDSGHDADDDLLLVPNDEDDDQGSSASQHQHAARPMVAVADILVSSIVRVCLFGSARCR